MTAPTRGAEPAYPCEREPAPPGFQRPGNEPPPMHGLSKRELIAAMAMQGMLAHARDTTWVMPPEQVAVIAVEHADALLAELAR